KADPSPPVPPARRRTGSRTESRTTAIRSVTERPRERRPGTVGQHVARTHLLREHGRRGQLYVKTGARQLPGGRAVSREMGDLPACGRVECVPGGAQNCSVPLA